MTSLNSDTETRLAEWLMINYIKKEGFSEEHIYALTHIVTLINQCEESEKEILDFARHIFSRYGWDIDYNK